MWGSATTEIKNDHVLYQELNLEENRNLRRMFKYWCCHFCQTSEQTRNVNLSQSLYKTFDFNGVTILYPETDNNQEELVYTANTLILFPKKPVGGSKQLESFSPPLYKLQPLTNQFLSTLYRIREAKFNSRQIFADLYDGNILNTRSKEVGSMAKIIDTSKIRGSVAWKNNQRKALHGLFNQYGFQAISFNMDVDVNNLQSIATSMICSGKVISLDFVGSINDEYSVKYYEHNHDNSEDCSPACIKTLLNFDNLQLESRYLPIFINDLAQKQQAFVESFVRNVNFGLHSGKP